MAPIAQAEEIFHEALRLAKDADRNAWLAQRCGDRADLLEEVTALLEAHDAMAAFTEPAAPRSAPTIPHDQFGAYRLVSLLGRGGMSAVYLAERVDGRFDKQVAVKVMAAYLSGEEFLRKWSAEAQFLASLQHPNIPTLLDSGVSSSGHPYLVVDYVKGEPLDQYCDQRKLGIEARLRLFLQVCQAVEYAHRALILHRDLKPSNILVTADGVVKLLDFGTASQMAEGSHVTVTRARMLTPRYASPEQLRGERPGVTGDVFSLGVILYELLTGAWPFGDPNSVLSELRRATGNATPTAPSSAITEEAPAQRSLAPNRLKSLLAGDLSAILMKALENDPAARYATVAEFAADITRFLEGRPVEAHPQTLLYRTGKFLKRHWLVVAAAAVFVIGLSTATLLALHQAQVARAEARKAEAEAKKSESVTNFLRSMLSSAIRSGGADVTVLQMLNASEPTIEQSWKGDALAEATLRVSLGTSYVTLSQPDRAKLQLERALTLFQSLGRSADAADTLYVLGVNAQGHVGSATAAVDYYQRALELFQRAGKDASPLRVFRTKAFLAGVLYSGFYRLDEADALLDQALDMATHDSRIPRSELPFAWTHKGQILMEQARFDEAEAFFRQVIATDVHVADAWTGLARSRFLRQDFRAAADFARQNREVMVNYAKEHLADSAEAEVEYARYQAESGHAAEAVSQIQAALPSIKRVYITGYQRGYYLQAAARVFNKAARFDEGAKLAREALLALHEAEVPERLPIAAASNEDLGSALFGLKRYREAVPCLEQALKVDRQLGPAYTHIADGVQAVLDQARKRSGL